ncbi:MAG: 3-oxo-tetronate kinase [Clostridia bacterium]
MIDYNGNSARDTILGCVADDFTGASDMASFLAAGGMKTLLVSGIPNGEIPIDFQPQAIIIALKSRTSPTAQAVSETMAAFSWLVSYGATKLYFKYCSTFDSTPRGNIGPVVDQVLESYDIPFTILCPALPVNGRTVKDGHLYVNGVPLHESPMRNHPLTPMWDSDMCNLMEPQSKYPCFKLTDKELFLPDEEILRHIEKLKKKNRHFYLVPDYYTSEHADRITALFRNLPFITGGSGIAEGLAKSFSQTKASNTEKNTIERDISSHSLILAGSCSEMTLKQIDHFINTGGTALKIVPSKLLSGEQTKESLWDFIKRNSVSDVLIYSSDIAVRVAETQKMGKEHIAQLLEQTTAYLASKAVKNGIVKIIVAGGETSGAVTQALDYQSFLIGESVSPGVPVMIPTSDTRIRLVLKSGNFGQPDFFSKAIEITRR